MSDLPVKIRRQKRASMMMRRTPDAVEVYIPHWMKESSRQVRRFVRDGLKQLERMPPPAAHDVLTPPAEIRALAREWAGRMGLEPKRITLRTMNRKWGSCSSGENITLNALLRFLPRHLVEYVVVHELVHLLVFNHGPEFKQTMSRTLPGWEVLERELSAVRL